MGYYAAGGYYSAGGFGSFLKRAVGRINVGKLASFVAKTPMLQSALSVVPGASTIIGGLQAIKAIGGVSARGAVAKSLPGPPGALAFHAARGLRRRFRRSRRR